MKRFLCILLCLLMAAPLALADDYTPRQLFRQQFITGGNGLRGTVSVTASGVAEWLDMILPFTAAPLQVRIIGEAQAAHTALVTDDDDWQAKLWVKDAQEEQQGLTYVYGTPDGIFFRSELLPGELLTLPVQNVHLPYQIADAETAELLHAFNPMGLPEAAESGNVTAWSALGQIFTIDDGEWEAQWAPVLVKYETLMDMWLADYATPTVLTGTAGHMTLRTSYDVPVSALKAQMKYIVRLMMSDAELLGLLAPCLTDEQRSLYLNPAMLWFYEHCIDALPLNGSVALERETTLLGETTAVSVSLPLTALPQELTDPLGRILQQLFSLPYADALSGLERLSVRQAGDDLSISLSSQQRTITMQVNAVTEEASQRCDGYLRITPAVGNDQPPLSAAFTCAASQRIWEDEAYNTHEDMTWSLEMTPDLSLVAPEDEFHSTYIEFAPLSFSAQVGFTKRERISSPVQLAIEMDARLPQAELALSASLKMAERWAHDPLPVTGGEDVTTMPIERREALRTQFVQNATQTMMNLYAAPVQD